MSIYDDANKRLAIAKGWTNVFDVGGGYLMGTPPVGHPAHSHNNRMQAPVPNWCYFWLHCGTLLAEYHIEFEWYSLTIRIEHGNAFQSEAITDHADKDTALRYAIVVAAAIRQEYINERRSKSPEE